MGYLADENGRWKRRWIDIHRQPVKRRMAVHGAEAQGIRKLEGAFADEVLAFFSEAFESSGLAVLVQEGLKRADASGTELEWSVVVRSHFISELRPLARVSASMGQLSLKFEASASAPMQRCARCHGTGVSGLKVFEGLHTAEELVESFASQGTQPVPAFVLDRLREADEKLFWLIDEGRAKGALDHLVRAIDEALYSSESKHLVDYWIEAYACHRVGGDRAMRGLGKIRPGSACVVERAGVSHPFSSWSEAAKFEGKKRPASRGDYHAPCPDCDGRGAGASPR